MCVCVFGPFYGSASMNDVLGSLNIDSPGIVLNYESTGLISSTIGMFCLSQTLATIDPEFIPFTNSEKNIGFLMRIKYCFLC